MSASSRAPFSVVPDSVRVSSAVTVPLMALPVLEMLISLSPVSVPSTSTVPVLVTSPVALRLLVASSFSVPLLVIPATSIEEFSSSSVPALFMSPRFCPVT